MEFFNEFRRYSIIYHSQVLVPFVKGITSALLPFVKGINFPKRVGNV